MPTIATPALPRGPLRLGRLADDRLAALAAAGVERAFEELYDRHHRALLGFCRHLVGSPDEAEDALQQTFMHAHRALVRNGPPRDLRPWLFTIARHCSWKLLAGRRPAADGDLDEGAELASAEGLGEQVQARADLRALVADVARLPAEQREALVLAELADLSHDQIAEVIAVRPGKVKALIHQARTTLIAERQARETPCAAIREQLATARGGELRRGPLRRHLRRCAPCRAYRGAVAQQRRALALALPAVPSVGLKAGVIGAASSAGGAGAAAIGGGAAASLAGGLAGKLAAGALLVAGATGGGVAALDGPSGPSRPAPAAAEAADRPPSTAPAAPKGAVRLAVGGTRSPAISRRGRAGRSDRARTLAAKRRPSRDRDRRDAARGSGESSAGRPQSPPGRRHGAERGLHRRNKAAPRAAAKAPRSAAGAPRTTANKPRGVKPVVPGAARTSPRASVPTTTGRGAARSPARSQAHPAPVPEPVPESAKPVKR